MVNLKYVENPFTDDYLASFEYFRSEKLFYDCISRKIINSNDVFDNLGFSFYTYLLTGDSGEWIGYVMFHNEDLVNGYLETVQLELKKLLLKLKNIIKSEKVLDDINKLLVELNNCLFSTTVSLSKLEDRLNILRDGCVNENNENNSCFKEYYSNISKYLYDFDKYYYLDIVISLPLNVEKGKIEANYYGFVREVCNDVEKLIQDKFNSIPIFLKSMNSEFSLINDNNCQAKVLCKDITNR